MNLKSGSRGFAGDATGILITLNMLIAVGMATSVFTGQLRVHIDNPWLPLVFPASNIFFALLTFPVTDIIADVFGAREARRAVYIGFVSQLLTIFIIHVSLMFPGESVALEQFAQGGWRVLLGSAVAYFAAQMWDVWIFHWIKQNVTGDAHLWLRNNISTLSSQFINTCLFITIVFGPEALWIMLPGSIVIKFIIAVIDTPLVYAARFWIVRHLDG